MRHKPVTRRADFLLDTDDRKAQTRLKEAAALLPGVGERHQLERMFYELTPLSNPSPA